MNKIYIIITTFNRTDMLTLLLSDIAAYKNQYDFTIAIYDDSSQPANSKDNFTSCTLALHGIKFSYHRSHTNHGKKQYYKLINKAFSEVEQADFVFMLADDMRLLPNFFDKAISLWHKIADNNKACLNLDTDKLGSECWTRFVPIDYLPGIMLSGWVDMCFIAQARFFKEFKPIYVNPKRWEISELLSSGVGEVISKDFFARNLNMYQIMEPLLTHGNHESKMNPLQQLKK